MSPAGTVHPLVPLVPARISRRVFVRDLVLGAKIGVYTHERAGTQPVRINVDLGVVDDGPLDDRIERTVCYEAIVEGIKGLLAAGHINLVETLAERIADLCLADRRVREVRVRVEKLGAIPEAAGVGVEIARERPHP